MKIGRQEFSCRPIFIMYANKKINKSFVANDKSPIFAKSFIHL